MRKRLFVIALAAITAAATFALTNAHAGGGPIGFAQGHQQISSGPGVYAQTTSEYAGSWIWTQESAAWDYYWYVFHNNGTLAGSGHNANGGGGSWSGAPNIYYFKEYNNEPLGSGHVNVLGVDYCC